MFQVGLHQETDTDYIVLVVAVVAVVAVVLVVSIAVVVPVANKRVNSDTDSCR